jgi:hypothetical protein
MPRVASLLCLVSLGLLASCSSFDMRYNSTKPLPTANPAALADGKWEGTWQSDATDFAGHIQALIHATTQTTYNEQKVQQYSATFKFYYLEFFGYDEYSVTLNATTLPDGRVHFEGKKDLGYFRGGIIRFDGIVYPNTDTLFCDYASDSDTGTYKMRRIVLENQ